MITNKIAFRPEGDELLLLVTEEHLSPGAHNNNKRKGKEENYSVT